MHWKQGPLEWNTCLWGRVWIRTRCWEHLLEHPNHLQSFCLELSKNLVCSCVQPPLHCNCDAYALPPLLPGATVGENKVCLLFQSVWVSLEGDAVGFNAERPSSRCRGATGSFSCIASQRTPELWKCPSQIACHHFILFQCNWKACVVFFTQEICF